MAYAQLYDSRQRRPDRDKHKSSHSDNDDDDQLSNKHHKAVSSSLSLDVDVLADLHFASAFLVQCVELVSIQDYHSMKKVCKRWRQILTPDIQSTSIGHRGNIPNSMHSLGQERPYSWRNAPSSFLWAPIAKALHYASAADFCVQFTKRDDDRRSDVTTPFEGHRLFDCRSTVYDFGFQPPEEDDDDDEKKDLECAFEPMPLGNLTWVVTWKETKKSPMYHRLARFLLTAKKRNKSSSQLLQQWLELHPSDTGYDTTHGDLCIKASHQYLMAFRLWPFTDDDLGTATKPRWSQLRSAAIAPYGGSDGAVDTAKQAEWWRTFTHFILYYQHFATHEAQLLYAHFFRLTFADLPRYDWAMHWTSDDEWLFEVDKVPSWLLCEHHKWWESNVAEVLSAHFRSAAEMTPHPAVLTEFSRVDQVSVERREREKKEEEDEQRRWSENEDSDDGGGIAVNFERHLKKYLCNNDASHGWCL